MTNSTTEMLEKCASACKKCADNCNNCADDCKDKPGMETCIKLCNDCSAVATQCAIDCETNSENKKQSILACIKACEDCATECEKHDNAVCLKCAETCRACAKECKNTIEQKNTIWIWLSVGLVIIVGLLMFYMAFNVNGNNTNTESNTIESDRGEVKEINDTVAAYINFVENNEEVMSLDHAYTNEALVKLAKAINAKANEVGYEVRADLEKVKEYGEMITHDPFETTHADNIKKATEILANVLQNIQKAKYPGLADEAEELKSASSSIKSELHTLKQKDAVKNYFTKASELLKKMN